MLRKCSSKKPNIIENRYQHFIITKHFRRGNESDIRVYIYILATLTFTEKNVLEVVKATEILGIDIKRNVISHYAQTTNIENCLQMLNTFEEMDFANTTHEVLCLVNMFILRNFLSVGKSNPGLLDVPFGKIQDYLNDV